MNRIMLTYGAISGAVIALATFGSMALHEGEGAVAEFEWLGYAIMIIALSVIFFAVKSYRDDRLGGAIRFWTAFRLGLGISIVAGVVYVLGWEIYYQTLGGDFMERYRPRTSTGCVPTAPRRPRSRLPGSEWRNSTRSTSSCRHAWASRCSKSCRSGS